MATDTTGESGSAAADAAVASAPDAISTTPATASSYAMGTAQLLPVRDHPPRQPPRPRRSGLTALALVLSVAVVIAFVVWLSPAASAAGGCGGG